MPARLNLNQIPLVSWKGLTIQEVNSKIIQNDSTLDGKDNLFRATPLKIPRREIATKNNSNTCNTRTSITIDTINRPGGLVSNTAFSDPSNNILLTSTLDLENNTCEYPGTCNPIVSPAENAKKRVRSSGMVRQKYHATSNDKVYHTNTKEYLHSRNMTYKQNQFVFSNPDNTCFKTYYNPSNSQFGVQGAVTSGDLVTRKKYNTITDAASSYQTPLGNHVANALSYGVSNSGYTIKDKIGYPLKQTPTHSKYSDTMKKCFVTRLANAI